MKEAFQIIVYAHDGVFFGNKKTAAEAEAYFMEHPTAIGAGQMLLVGTALTDFSVRDTLLTDNDNPVRPRRFCMYGREQDDIFAGMRCGMICEAPIDDLSLTEGAVLYLQQDESRIRERGAFPLNDPEIQQTAEEIAALGKPLRIYLISHKTHPATGDLISFKLALIVRDDTKNISELECFLYTGVDCACPYDLVLYKESEWESLSQDPRTFAWSIRETGTVLYEGRSDR